MQIGADHIRGEPLSQGFSGNFKQKTAPSVAQVEQDTPLPCRPDLRNNYVLATKDRIAAAVITVGDDIARSNFPQYVR